LPPAEVSRDGLVTEFRSRAAALGFDAFGVTGADARPDLPAKLAEALARGWQDGMEWMAETASRRGAPAAMWPEARSVIVLGMNYGPDVDPMERLADLAQLDEAGFRALFAGSPVKRIGYTRFLRNVMIAVGNSRDAALIPTAEARLGDPAPLIRGAAVWAVRQLAPPERIHKLALAFLPSEGDMEVRAEWDGVLTPLAAV
jgi:epoxyqueuosine reductase QueG